VGKVLGAFVTELKLGSQWGQLLWPRKTLPTRLLGLLEKQSKISGYGRHWTHFLIFELGKVVEKLIRLPAWVIDRFDPSSGRTFPTILLYFRPIPHLHGTTIANIAVLSPIAHIYVQRHEIWWVARHHTARFSVKLYMLSFYSASHKCCYFSWCHHALYAHTTNYQPAAISRFIHFWIKIFVVFGSFLHWKK